MRRIPANDKYKIHKAFDPQIQSLCDPSVSNYFKNLTTKNMRAHEGDVSFR